MRTAPCTRRDLGRTALAIAAATAFPVSGSTAESRALQLARGTLIVDGLDPSALTTEYLAVLKTAGVGCWHHSIGSDFASFARLLNFCDANKDRIAPAGSVAEIRDLNRRGLIAHVAGWQSADGLIVDGEAQPQNLRAYHELGLRICGIAYNLANPFGGGCLDPQPGLTRAGHRLVEEVHRLRIVLDVGGHTNEPTSFDAIAMSRGVPVVCTHTNLRALNDNPRCSTDRLLEAIARTGGVIGLSAFNDFHARKASDAAVAMTPQVGLDRHLDQYDYLKRLVGADHIGLGPDFLHGRNDAGSLSPSDTLLMAPEAYSQRTPWYYVKGFESIAELPNITEGLLARGWTAGEVRKLLGENWLRVYRQVWNG